MAQSVLTRPKVALSVDRSAADRSRIGNFHSHAGLLDMVLCEPCIAGTKGVINRKSFTRSSQVLFPAFINVKEYYDFFKVPLRYLWSRWNDWKLNINDLHSTMQNTLNPRSSANPASPNLALPNTCPRVDFKGVYQLYELTISQSVSFTTEANNFLRLADQCGYMHRAASDSQSNTLNLFKAAAYQKVYYDHYRNTTYESNNPFAYNFDWLNIGGDASNVDHNGQFNLSSATDCDVLQMIFKMHYVNWQNDFFHNIYPALNYTVSVPNGSNWSVPSSVLFDFAGNSSGQSSSPLSSVGNAGQVGINYPRTDWDKYSVVSVQQIRAAFALDKLMRASAYTPKHVKDQLKSRFGVDVGDKVSFESERIGGFVSDVNFGEVTQTVDTSAAGSPSNLGSVGGKGVGMSDFESDLNFYCEEDSLIVGIHYFIPTALYDKAQDEWSQKLYREDFFQPEFQNLGLRPIVQKNIQGSALLSSSYSNSIVGYTVPNELYKIGKNENFMMFNYRYNMFGYDSANNKYKFYTNMQSPLSSFVTHSNYSPTVINSIDANYFKVKPSSLDPLFAEQFDGTPASDQFFGSYRIKFAVVHPMDVHGQPSL